MSDNAAPRIRAKRAAMVLGAIVLFVGVARIIQPGTSRATETAPAQRVVIGTLVGPQYHVQITAGDADPLYTVMTPEGEILERDMLAHEVYHFFPELDVTKLQFGVGDATGPVMLADD